MPAASAHEIPEWLSDEDSVVRTAVERENGRFSLTNGQEKTLEKAASGDQ
jgi:hypothetical protein